MSAPRASARQIGAIHALAAKAGMDEDTYRDFLAREASVRSASTLTASAAGSVIDKLKDLAGQPSPAKGAVAGLNTPVAGKMRALWIAGWNLGLVRDRTDRAMLSFLERQTGVSHVRFLAHPSDATSAIEALKDWLARDGGVAWPKERDDVLGQKWSVLRAQLRKLVQLGALESDALENVASFALKAADKSDWRALDSRDCDLVSAALGRRLRAILERAEADHAE